MMRSLTALFVRVLSRNSDVYSLEVVTLAIAFDAGVVVTLFSIHEFGYDAGQIGADHVFRMLACNTDKDYSGNRLSALIPGAVLKGITNRFDDPVVISRVKTLNRVIILDPLNRPIYDQRVHAADPTIDKIFSFDITAGSEIGGVGRFQLVANKPRICPHNVSK
jgi:hypothetical protein